MGPNGSGKTTLLKSMLKYLKPNSGSVIVDGKNIDDLNNKEIARIIAIISQVISVNFDFSVEDIVMME
ncbi:ABC transporter ATP-binding protein [Methanolobus vulcani]|uniref:ATP-binding cassette domain-containing protein n=1 Tax=Methanolobus vulcani TaxID=38026 RepID=UPI001E53AA8C|nr:ABC transporter ATP-binding protein [Methanolobus vulcani]